MKITAPLDVPVTHCRSNCHVHYHSEFCTKSSWRLMLLSWGVLLHSDAILHTRWKALQEEPNSKHSPSPQSSDQFSEDKMSSLRLWWTNTKTPRCHIDQHALICSWSWHPALQDTNQAAGVSGWYTASCAESLNCECVHNVKVMHCMISTFTAYALIVW